MNRHGGKQKPFSLADRMVIERMIKQGHTGGEIAKVLGRSKTGTNWEIRNHGGRESYTAKKADKMAREAQIDRIEKLRTKQRARRPTIHQRLDALDMQINILKDTIKELLAR